jgi:hypothetical protein
VAGTSEVTLGVSRNLPAAKIATRMSSLEHALSQAEEKRRNRAFLWSQAGGADLHPASQAKRGAGYQTSTACIPWAWLGRMQVTKHPLEY